MRPQAVEWIKRWIQGWRVLWGSPTFEWSLISPNASAAVWRVAMVPVSRTSSNLGTADSSPSCPNAWMMLHWTVWLESDNAFSSNGVTIASPSFPRDSAALARTSGLGSLVRAWVMVSKTIWR